MKIRGSIYRVALYAAIALLVCSGLSVAAFRIARGSSHKNISPRSASARGNGSSRTSSPGNQAKWLQAYGQLPLSFMENQGQTAQEVRYVSHGSEYDLFLTPAEAVVALRHNLRHYDMSPRHRAQSIKAMLADRKAGITTTALRMQFEGANRDPEIAGADALPGKVNYYIGNDPKKWHKNIPTFAQVKYRDMYPGVDLVFYGNQRKLEYDFVVAPGADPNVIRMKLTGARKMRLDAQGNVVLSVKGGDVQLEKPLIYQNIDGQRREIAGKYTLRGAQVSFAVAKYDRREALIVDPILNYSTYIGGTSDETGFAIATDSSGDAYIGGATDSTDFPTAGAGTVTSNAGGITVGFVSELNPTGTAVLESAYIGGTGDGDQIYGLAVDSSSNVYATGLTVSTDFPTTAANALKPTLSSNANGTSFLVESNPSGSVFYSTYLGGTGGDYGNAVAADAAGNAYVTGVTYSAAGSADVDFPVTTGAYQSALPNANGSAFLTRINTTLSGAASLIYSSYLGGDGANFTTAALFFGDSGYGVAVDGAHKAYLSGTTTSSNFPTSTGAFQPTANVANLYGEAFVSEIDTTASGAASLVYSTYLGGSGTVNPSPPPPGFGDFANAIDLRTGTTVAYVTGYTNSADFPTTTGAYQTVGDAANGAAFVTLVDTSVSGALKYSTYLGSGFTTGYGIKADATTGNAYIGGATASTAFPTTPGAYQTTLAAGASGDGYIAEIHPAGGGAADLVYGTYFGGSGVGSPDQIYGLALGTLPNVFVTGQTFSTNLPATMGAFQTTLHGSSDAFAASLNLTAPSLVVAPSSLTFTATAEHVATAAQTVTLTNNSNSVITFTGTAILNPTPAAAATDFAVTGTTCTAGVPALGTCTISVVFTASASTESATLSIIDSDASSPQSVALTGTAPAIFSVSPTTLTFSSPAVGTATAAQSVTLTNNSSAAVAYTSSAVTLTSATGAAADFALAPATTCGASIPASGGTCTVSITYTPSVATAEAATLTIIDGAGTQTVALTGSVVAVAPDFGLSAAPVSLTVKKGASGTSTITVTSIGAFNSAVALTCTGDPRKSTCAIAPGSLTPTAGGTVTATLTLTTKSLVTPPPSSLRYLPPVSIRVVVPAAFAALLMLLMFLSERRFRTRLGLAAATMVFVALAGCGGSGTPKGTSTLTVTGTSGSTTHTVTIALTVD